MRGYEFTRSEFSSPHGAFPPTELRASRTDQALQMRRGKAPESLRAGARSCPACGAGAAELSWFWYESSAWTWEMLCGRAGWVSFCDRDDRQVQFFLEEMS
jgi:hypothetical protein